MRVVLDLDFGLVGSRAVCVVFRRIVEAQALANYAAMRRRPLPPLFESGVVWRAEPNAGRFEELAGSHRCYSRGWGDCDDLIAWRLAELWLAGERDARARIYVKFVEYRGKKPIRHLLAAAAKRAKDDGRKVKDLFHVQVRRGSIAGNEIEDVSRLLGM